MSTMNGNYLVLGLALAIGTLSLACGDEATIVGQEPPGNGAQGGTGGSAGQTGVAGTGEQSTAGTAGTGGTAGAAGTGGTSGQADCVEEPSAPADFLVRCTDSACRPFDNAARLGRFVVGQPLPEVP